jgi:DNA modification methylase
MSAIDGLKSKTIFNDVTIYNEDCCTLMREMIKKNIKVNLTVTSPPYDDLRSYDGVGDAWNFDKFKEIANLLYDITSDSGTVVWVVGDACVKGGETLTSFKQALYFKDIGFTCHDTMIYEKNSSSFPARRDGKRYTQIFEYMFVFTKGKIKTGHLICDRKNKWFGFTNWGSNTQYEKDGTMKTTKDIKPVPEFSPRTNIWKYTTGFNINVGKHSAVFPYKLAEDHILSWSDEGDIIFDPFSGSGTVASAAINNKRKFIGSEIVEQYFNDSFTNIEMYVERKTKEDKKNAG